MAITTNGAKIAAVIAITAKDYENFQNASAVIVDKLFSQDAISKTEWAAAATSLSNFMGDLGELAELDPRLGLLLGPGASFIDISTNLANIANTVTTSSGTILKSPMF
jgi:hypothetical protein